MFSDLLESVGSKQKTNRRWTVMLSVALQTAGVLAVILMPLVYTHALPTSVLSRIPLAPYLVPPPEHATPVHVANQPGQSNGGVWLHVPESFTTPGRPSPGRGTIDFHGSMSTPPDEVGPIGVWISGPALGSGLGPAGPTGPPAPPAPDTSHRRIKTGGQVEAARLISRPRTHLS